MKIISSSPSQNLLAYLCINKTRPFLIDIESPLVPDLMSSSCDESTTASSSSAASSSFYTCPAAIQIRSRRMQRVVKMLTFIAEYLPAGWEDDDEDEDDDDDDDDDEDDDGKNDGEG